jgi:hypothetical protein
MTIALKAFRLTPLPALLKVFNRPSQRFLPSSFGMNSGTASFQTSFNKAEGMSGAAPKQMSQLQPVKLNDGNEVPQVHF